MAKTKNIVAAVATPAEAAALEAVMAEMKAGFAQALKDALAPLVAEINTLQQRSENFATRVSAHRMMTTARVRALEAQVEALKPKVRVVAMSPFTRALNELRAERGLADNALVPLKDIKARQHANSLAAAHEKTEHESFRVQNGLPKSEEQRFEDEEVTL